MQKCVYKHREWKEMSKEESLSASWEAQQRLGLLYQN